MVAPLVRSMTPERSLFLFDLETPIFEIPFATWHDQYGANNWARLREPSGPLKPGYYNLNLVRDEWVVSSSWRIPLHRADWHGPYFTGWRFQRIYQGELSREEAEQALAVWRSQLR